MNPSNQDVVAAVLSLLLGALSFGLNRVRVGGQRHWERPRDAVVLVAAALTALAAGTTFRWWLALPGVEFLLLALLATHARLLQPYPWPASRRFSRVRAALHPHAPSIHTGRVGLLLTAIGATCLLGTPLVAIGAGAVLVVEGARLHRDMRRREHRRIEPLLWAKATWIPAAISLPVLAWTGSVIAGDWRWVTSSENARPALEALLTSEIAVAAVVAAVVGLAIQLRAQHFGGNLAIQSITWWPLLVAALFMLLSFLTGVYALGHLSADVGASVSFTIQGAFLSLAIVLWAATPLLRDAFSSRALIDRVRRAASELPETDLTTYASNADQREMGVVAPWTKLPPSLKILDDAIRGAILYGDRELLYDICLAWHAAIRQRDFFGSVHESHIDWDRRRERLRARPLTPNEALAVDGLDRGYLQIVESVALMPQAGAGQLNALTALISSLCPPLVLNQDAFPRFDHSIEGLRATDALVRAALERTDAALASWLIDGFLRHSIRMAMIWEGLEIERRERAADVAAQGSRTEIDRWLDESIKWVVTIAAEAGPKLHESITDELLHLVGLAESRPTWRRLLNSASDVSRESTNHSLQYIWWEAAARNSSADPERMSSYIKARVAGADALIPGGIGLHAIDSLVLCVRAAEDLSARDRAAVASNTGAAWAEMVSGGEPDPWWTSTLYRAVQDLPDWAMADILDPFYDLADGRPEFRRLARLLDVAASKVRRASDQSMLLAI